MSNREKIARELAVSLIEQARLLCQQHSFDWLELVEQSKY